MLGWLVAAAREPRADAAAAPIPATRPINCLRERALLRFIGGLLNPAAEHVYDIRRAIAIRSMNTTRRSFIAGSMASPLLRSAAAEDRPNVLGVVLDDL